MKHKSKNNKVKKSTIQELMNRDLGEHNGYTIHPISDNQKKAYNDLKHINIPMVFSPDGLESCVVCSDGIFKIEPDKSSKDAECCMCGCELNEESGKHDPDPYPKELFLDNNSSFCCDSCNAIASNVRKSGESLDTIVACAKLSKIDDIEKRQLLVIIDIILKNQLSEN